jgi:hypothetical protein
MPHNCWHLGTHKVHLIISGIHFIPGIPGIILFPVYRKARGPVRFRQHTPLIQMFPQLGSDNCCHSSEWHSSYWAPLGSCEYTLVCDSFSRHSCAFFCCALLCIFIIVKTSSLPREVKIIISSCGSPGQLAINSCECMFCSPLCKSNHLVASMPTSRIHSWASNTLLREHTACLWVVWDRNLEYELRVVITNFNYTAHHWVVAASMPTYLERLYCSSLSFCGFRAGLSWKIVLLIIEQLRLPCRLILTFFTAHHWAVAASMPTYFGIIPIFIAVSCQLIAAPCRLMFDAASLPSYLYIGIIANPTLLWDYAA